MNKNHILIINILMLIIIILFLFSCPVGSENDNDENNKNPDQPAPEWITGEFRGDHIYVEWEEVDNTSSYIVYRKTGNSDLLEIGSASSAFYNDYDFSEDEVMYYAVVSVAASRASGLSGISNPVSKYIQGIEVTRLQFDDKIELIWIQHYNAVSYKVYRYESKTDTNPVVFSDITAASFIDQYDENDPLSPQVDTPYYYKVTWIQLDDADPVEYGTGGKFTAGLFSTSIDYHENNDDWSYITDQNLSSVFSSSQPPIIYSLSDGEKDIDWYKYYGPVQNIMININSITGFTDQLRFQFYTDFDSVYTTPEVIDSFIGDNYFSFGFSGYDAAYLESIKDEDGNVNVYFRIYPETSVGNVIGSYFVEIE